MKAYDKVLQIAHDEVGYLEKKTGNLNYLYTKNLNAGYNNYTKYWQLLKPSWQGQAWCNCFVNYIMVQAYGETIAKKLLCTDGNWSYYTPTSAGYFKNKKQWGSTPKIGSVIYFKNSVRICHVGIVYNVDNTYVYTIEGNTSTDGRSNGNDVVVANGGGVAYKKYPIGYASIAGYGYPDYEKYVDTNTYYDIATGAKGLIITASSLNIRKEPDISAAVVDTYKENESIYPTQKVKTNNGTWFKTDKGYVSAKYAYGWIKEGKKWWYVLEGYNYPAAVWLTIDGVEYHFDINGWLDTSEWILDGKEYYYVNSDGAKVYNKYVLSANGQVWYYIDENGVWDTYKDVTTKPHDSMIAK